MITNPFVNIETKPWQHENIDQGIKMPISTLTELKYPKENFYEIFQTIANTP